MYHYFIFSCQYSLIWVPCILFIHPSGDEHLSCSTFWLRWIMLLWTFLCMFFCGRVFVFISLGYIPGSGSAGSYGNFTASQVVLVIRNSPANAGDIEMWARSLGGEGPLKEGTAAHSSVLAWRIPRTEELGGRQSSRITQSRTRLKQLSVHTHVITLYLTFWWTAKLIYKVAALFYIHIYIVYKYSNKTNSCFIFLIDT